MNNEYVKLNLFPIFLIILLIIFFIHNFFPAIALTNGEKLDKTIEHRDYRKEYFSLLKALKNTSIDIPESYRDKITKYLAKHTQSIIDLKIDGENWTWFIVKLFFIRNDLIYAQFEDGEMYGGAVLLKVNFSGSKIISIQRLWASYK